MAVFNGVFPILPGKEQAGRDFAAECLGERRKGFEAPDIEKAFMNMATTGDEFSTWFLGQVKDVTGVDMSAPPAGPLPDVLVDWTP